MATDASVKMYHSELPGAPTLTGQVGSVIAILDACLKDGWGLGTVDSVVIAGGVGTVTRGAGHPFEVGMVALLAGATVTGGTINGDQKVLSVTATQWTFDATGISNQTATGTITQKISPLGFSKVYTGTNLAAYKPNDVTANGFYLRVDDTNAQVARTVGYESMSDVNTGVNPFPTNAQMSGGYYWTKSDAASSATRKWMLFGDSKLFYFFPAYYATNPNNFASHMLFGDPIPVKTPDPYFTAILGAGVTQTDTVPGSTSIDLSCAVVAGAIAARAFTSVGAPVGLRWVAAAPTGISSSTFSGTAQSIAAHMPYPNGADGAIYMGALSICENANGSYRGIWPGFVYVPHSVGSAFSPRDPVAGTGAYAGKIFRAIPGNNGVSFVDLTGPWR